MKKSILKVTGIVAFSALVLTSCHKTVTPRKLDGEWKVTGMTGTETETDGGFTDVTTITYDGTNITYAQAGYQSTSPLSVSYTFDKKAGTYTATIVETYTVTDENITYYEDGGFGFGEEGSEQIDQKDVVTSTSVETGTFTVTGGTGDIEKNTQIVLLPTSNTSTTSHVYSYYMGTTAVSVSDKYTSYTMNTKLPTSLTQTNSDSGVTTSATVMTVTELKKGVMTVEMKDESTEVSGAFTSSYKNNMTWTLTEQ